MAYARETGVMKAIKTLIFFTLLPTCWGPLGGVQDPQYHNAVSFPYGGGSSPDIELNNGTKIDPCGSQRIYPCFTYDSEAKVVDIRSNHWEDLMQLKIFGTPINASREQICCGYSLAGNLTNNVSCPDMMNDTRLYFDDHDCLSIHLSYILANAFLILILIISLWYNIYSCCKNRSPTKERVATVLECGTYQQLRRNDCLNKLTEWINEVCICTTPTKFWQCLCEKPCHNLTKPVLFNYEDKSYVIFIIEKLAERSNCIDPHLEKYKQNFHTADVFVVYMDDVETATSAKYLPVWYKESRRWNHSLLKDKVFLSKPVLQQTPGGNSRSGVIAKSGAIQELTEVPKVLDKVVMDPPVQMNLVEPQSQENKERGSPVHGITHRRSFSLVGSTSVIRMGAGGIALGTVEERKEFKVRSASYNALTTLDPVLKDKDEEPTYTPMRAST